MKKRAHLEIERKFLVPEPPPGWKRRRSSQIAQGYFPMATHDIEIRLRRKDSKSFITVKGGRGRRRTEEQIQLADPHFRALWPLTSGARISKKRYKIPYGRHTIEMDVYQQPHRGLVTADVEFASEKAARVFRPPPWFGREITGNRRYANETLARRHVVSKNTSRG